MNIKQLYPFAKKSLLFTAGFLVVILILEIIINITVKSINVGEYGVLNKLNDGEINAEIVVNGSSRALKAINPEIIESETGLTCYNIASDGSDLGVQLPKLQWYLSKNKSPKFVLLDVPPFNCDISETIYEPYKYLPYLSNDYLYRGLSKIDTDFWYHKYLYPTHLLYYNFDFYYRLLKEFYNSMNNNDQHIKGFLPDNSKWAADFDKYKQKMPDGINCYLTKGYKKYLNEFVDYCQSKDITIILVMTPNYFRLDEITNNQEKIISYNQELAEQSDVHLLNYLKDTITKSKDNFYNFTHLNFSGAQKFSKKISQDLLTIRTVQNNN